ncbi:MAG: MCP four helix bundle domain-containing protein [Pseudomonas sp.]|nr:MCP four helix bundle domain-containing protein [Pseudomonas sp.]
MTLAVLPLLILMAVIALALINSGRVNNNLQNLFVDRMKPIDQLKDVSDSYAVSMVDTVHKYRAGLFELERLQKEFSQARQTADSAWNNYTSTSLTGKERELITRAGQDRVKVSRLVGQLLQDAEAGKLRDVKSGAFNKLVYCTFDPLQTEISDLINIQLDEGASLFADSTAQF